MRMQRSNAEDGLRCAVSVGEHCYVAQCVPNSLCAYYRLFVRGFRDHHLVACEDVFRMVWCFMV